TAASTTQVRSNRLRANYTHDVRRVVGSGGIELNIGLLQGTADSKVIDYGRLVEGLNPDGSRFTSKEIRAKGDGWLTYPIFSATTPGMAKGNIVGWVRVKKSTFKPRPSF